MRRFQINIPKAEIITKLEDGIYFISIFDFSFWFSEIKQLWLLQNIHKLLKSITDNFTTINDVFRCSLYHSSSNLVVIPTIDIFI